MIRNQRFYMLWLCTILLFTVYQSSGQNCGSRDMSRVESGRNCRKSCTTHTQCRGMLKTCNCDDVCGMSCFNPNAECGFPDFLENGEIIGEDRTYGARVTYRCNSGFILEGLSTRICRSDRKWSGTVPTCRRGCDYPRRFGSAFPDASKDDYLVGESLNYICRFGYILTGSPEITCTRNGWSEPHFFCTRKICKDPGEPINGYRKGDDFRFGSRVHFFCNVGYELSQRQNFISCDTEGKWHGVIPSCEIVSCDAPSSPVRGSVDDRGVDYTYGSQVTYSCDFGYKVEGESIGRCNENMTWGALPICVVDKDCNFEDVRRPTCGFQNLGNDWVRTFSSNVPKGMRGFVARATFTSSQSNIDARLLSPKISRENSLCLRFYYLLGRISSSRDFTLSLVSRSGAKRQIWSPELRDRRNVWLSTDYAFNPDVEDLQIEFRAQERFRTNTLIDLDEITITDNVECVDECNPNPCRNRGTCVNRINDYTCYCLRGYEGRNCEIKIECRVPRSPQFGTVSVRTSSLVALDGTITYRCNHKYRMVNQPTGRLTVTCRENRRWSSSVPTCTEITCSRRSTPPNSRPSSTKSRWIVDDVLSYTCNDGYDLIGSASSTCLLSGRWSIDLPRCRLKRCPQRNISTFTSVNQNNKNPWVVGDFVSFSCYLGYEITSGSLTATCLNTGIWSDPLPTCTIKTCPQHQTPDFAITTPPQKIRWVYLDIITYECEEGYTLRGSRTSTCDANGRWSPEIPRCEETTCSNRDDPEFATTTPDKNRWLPTDVVTFVCNPGYDLIGSIQSTCQANGEWSSLVPSCNLADPAPCPADYVLDFPFCFKLSVARATYVRAKMNCEEDGATLPIIRHRNVQEKITRFLNRNVSWIGLNDIQEESSLIWNSGDEYIADEANLAFKPISHNTDKKNCISFYKGRLIWLLCNNTRNYACMKWHSQVIPFRLSSIDSTEKKYYGLYYPVEGKLHNQHQFYQLQRPSPVENLFAFVRKRLSKVKTWNFGPHPANSTIAFSVQLKTSFPQRIKEQWRLGGAESRQCVSLNIEPHDAWDVWSDWSFCSVQCGDGTQTRNRNCTESVSGSLICPGFSVDTRSCKTKDCISEDGTWGKWSKWSNCSVSCGSGLQVRWRFCKKEPHRGTSCLGEAFQSIPCNLKACPAAVTSVGNVEYLIFTARKRFNNARTSCQNLGGDLAMITNRNIQLHLFTEINKLSILHQTEYFIGLTDVHQEGVWRWLDESRLDNSNWGPGEPNDLFTEDCATIGPRHGKWNDLDCSQFRRYICERDFNPCSNLHCQNGGVCLRRQGSLQCDCFQNTTGKYCQQVTDPCASSPCMNEGTCHASGNSYYCECPENLFGPHCNKVVQCRGLSLNSEIVVNENAQDAYDIGTILTFRCSSITNQIENNDQITCRIDGTWNRDPPTSCIERRCYVISPLANGKIIIAGNIPIYSQFSEINFRCDDGFRLEGDDSITCNRNYMWTGLVPLCKEMGCRIYEPAIPKGVQIINVSTFEYEPGATLNVTCNEGNLNNDPKLTCIGRNIWEPKYIDYLCLHALTCLIPMVSDSVTIQPVQESYRIGETITFECVNSNYTLSGDGMVICNEDSNWNGAISSTCMP